MAEGGIPAQRIEEKLNQILGIVQEIPAMRKELADVHSQLTNLEGTVKRHNVEIQNLQMEMTEQKNLKQDFNFLASRVENLENRQRRANLRLRGFPPSVGELHNLSAELVEWMGALNIQIKEEDIERVHSIALRGKRDKDLIIRFSREAVKEEVFKQMKKIKDLKYKNEKILPLLDLSPMTIHKRQKLAPITRRLREANQAYTWGYPHTLIVYKNEATYKAMDVKQGFQMLRQLGLIAESEVAELSEEEEEGFEQMNSRQRRQKRRQNKPQQGSYQPENTNTIQETAAPSTLEVTREQKRNECEIFLTPPARVLSQEEGQETMDLELIQSLQNMDLERVKKTEKYLREIKKQKIKDEARIATTRSRAGSKENI